MKVVVRTTKEIFVCTSEGRLIDVRLEGSIMLRKYQKVINTLLFILGILLLVSVIYFYFFKGDFVTSGILAVISLILYLFSIIIGKISVKD